MSGARQFCCPPRQVRRPQRGGRRWAGEREMGRALSWPRLAAPSPPVFGPAWPTAYRRFAQGSVDRGRARPHPTSSTNSVASAEWPCRSVAPTSPDKGRARYRRDDPQAGDVRAGDRTVDDCDLPGRHQPHRAVPLRVHPAEMRLPLPPGRRWSGGRAGGRLNRRRGPGATRSRASAVRSGSCTHAVSASDGAGDSRLPTTPSC